jgi:hypothetical protein
MRLAALSISLALAAAAQTFPVAGVVVNAVSGTPMRRVRVTLTPAARPTDLRAVVTGADGRFAFDVPKGKFAILAEYRGLRQPFGKSGPATGFGVSIITGPDQDTSHLVFRWFAMAAIAGKVVDDRGEPVEDALVQLIRASVVSGHKRRNTVAWARTNDLGEYRFGQIPGGVYFLAVTGEPWYTTRSQAIPAINIPGREFEGGPTEPARSYAPVYYPNTNDSHEAQPLELATGAEFTADFRLRTITGVNVHVHCPHPSGQSALISLLSEGIAGAETYERQAWLTGSDHTIAGVAPGHYVVMVAARSGGTASARKAIDVGGSDVTVELELASAPSVGGKVIFKDPARKPGRPVYVRLIDDSNGAVIVRSIDPSGVFSFDDVPPGRRRVQINSAEGYFAAQITNEGGEVINPVLDIPPGANIRINIVATDEVGVLKGFVMNGDRPVAGVLAVLAPKNDSNDPDDYRGFQTDSDGSFDYQNVRAGEYILFAVESLDLEYKNPAAVRPHFASGKSIRITTREVVVENAILSSAAH